MKKKVEKKENLRHKNQKISNKINLHNIGLNIFEENEKF